MHRLFVLAAGLLLPVIFSSTQALAQLPQVSMADRIAKPMPQKSVAGLENPSSYSTAPPVFDNQFNPSAQAGVLSCVDATIIGYTQYDLQSNASVDNRLIAYEAGVHGTWTMSFELTPFSDRGTGFNESTGEGWGEIPFERIESVRTGWSSIGVTAAGRQVVVSHPGIADPLHMAWRDAGVGNWSEASVPSELEVGKLWPRMATGGLDGNSLHVICITTPIANGGMLHNNQDGALLYYRSLDGGNSWDIIDYSFAELDSANFFGFEGDTYAIHARGDMVAFAVFNDFSDSFVMISQDNGDTWEKQLLVDFPVDLYEIDAGLPEGETFAEDYNGDGLFQEYFNSDGAGAVHVDQFGQVHVSYGSMYYMDADTIDGTTSYFPGTNGLVYWNESMGPDSAQIIGYSYDYDENETLDFDGIALYYVGCASYPSFGSDAAGNLYVTYSAIMENFSTGLQNYRHQFLVHSTDGGMSWNADDALDLTPDEDFDGYEAVFGCMAPDVVNGEINITYQRDFEPGLHVRGDEDPSDINDIIHLRIPIELLDDFDLCEAGCTDPAACNFNPNTLQDNGSCEYESCAGCLDESACNYDEEATISDSCTYPEPNQDCDGFCVDPSACNFQGTNTGGMTLYEEGFEGFAPGDYVSDAPNWITWGAGQEGTDGDAQISDEQAHTGENSLHIYANSAAGGPLDVVMLVGLDEGVYTASWMMYVTDGNSAYYNIQEDVSPGVGWAFDVTFAFTGDLQVVMDGATVGSGVFPIEEWFEVRHDLDLDNDLITLTIAGNVVGSFTFDSPFGGVNFFGYGDGTTVGNWFMDDMEIHDATEGQVPAPCTYPGCMDPAAFNYDATAGCEEECIYLTYDCASIGYEAWSTEDMGLFPDWQEATHGVAWEGEWVLNIPETIVEPGSGVVYGVHHMVWTGLEGLPDWVETASYNLGELDASSQHCIAASGTPAEPGLHEISATGEVFISIFGQPFSIGEQSFSAWLEVAENPNPIPGCTYENAVNFVSYANDDDGSCLFAGCTDATAGNFNPIATIDDGSCGEGCDPAGDSTCQADNDGDGIITVSDLLILLAEFGTTCE